MREILFRGKRRDTGEWVEGSLQCFKGFSIFEPHVWKCYFTVNPATIGQYTGLKDKNGKRIFEGDILYSVHSKRNYPVFFGEYTYINDYGYEESACGWYNEEPDGYTALGNTEDWAVVVGNVHDNPELLGGGES